MGKIQSIGIANSGGDTPDLHAIIRGVGRSANNEFGWRVVGIRNGFDGLIRPEDCVELTSDSVSGTQPHAARAVGTAFEDAL